MRGECAPRGRASVRLRVREGVQSGETLRLRGNCAPRVNSSGHGDLIVHIEVQTPKKMTKEQRKLVEQLKELLPEGGQPAGKGLLEKLKDYLM